MTKNFITFVIAFIALLIDRLSKLWVSDCLLTDEPIVLIPHILTFYKVNNSGAAFGILKDHILFLSLFTAIVILSLSIWILRSKNELSMFSKTGFGLVLGGAAGNLVDRLVYFYVLDFIKLEFVDFPVFNFADVFINIGALLIIFELIFYHRSNERT